MNSQRVKFYSLIIFPNYDIEHKHKVMNWLQMKRVVGFLQ